MDDWEAKYKILAAGLSPEQVATGEKLLEKAKSFAHNSCVPFETAVDLVIGASKLREPKAQTLLGFPVEKADWLPANKAMIFGNFGAVITDLQTGECKVASKEDLERALRNIVGDK